jgi:hypothetical protein
MRDGDPNQNRMFGKTYIAVLDSQRNLFWASVRTRGKKWKTLL